MNPTCAAIIVAAGSSRRAGFDKLMAPLGDATVLQSSFDVFYNSPLIERIVLVTSEERFASILEVIGEPQKPIIRVDGGEERYLSVMAGLEVLPDHINFVAVHDGARPLLHPLQLQACIEAVAIHGAVASARPIVDTLKKADSENYSLPGEIKREALWAMETPQIFKLKELKVTYAKVVRLGLLVTDEVSAMEYEGRKTYLLQNNWPNPKITHPGDLEVAEILWRTQVR